MTPFSAHRRRSIVEAIVAIAVGVTVWCTFSRHLGTVICCVGVFVLVSGQFFPRAYHGFKRLGVLLGRAVGLMMSWLLLVPFFYTCFTAGRLVLLLTRNDPLRRRFPTDLPTYWVSRGPARGVESYKRQY